MARATVRCRNVAAVIPSQGRDWIVVVGAAFLVAAPAFLKWFAVMLLPWLAKQLAALLIWSISLVRGREPTPVGFGTGVGVPPLLPLRADDPTLTFAFLVASFCLGVATIILLLALPIYVLSADERRSKRAGTIVRQTLAFLLTSGGGVMAYLGFKR